MDAAEYLQGGMLGLQETDMIDYALGVDICQGCMAPEPAVLARWLDDHDRLMGVDQKSAA